MIRLAMLRAVLIVSLVTVTAFGGPLTFSVVQ